MKEILQKDHGYYEKIIDVYTTYIVVIKQTKCKKKFEFFLDRKTRKQFHFVICNIKNWNMMRSIIYVLLFR